ncbi:hypothetical protein Tco_0327604, partial [Tanacetum coccineum]
EVRQDPDEPVRVTYMIHGKLCELANDEIQEHLNKEERIKKKAKEAKLLAMTKSDLIKVVHEEAEKAGIDPKIIESAKGGEQFKKIQDVEHQVHKREHSQKVKRAMKLRQKQIDNYRWTTSSRLKPKLITNVKLDELSPVIEKKNKIVGELMTSLSKRYARLNKIPEELGIQPTLLALPAPTYEQEFSHSLERKRKHMELEPEIKFMVWNAFQRMSNINKVGVYALLTYLVMASNITTPENKSHSVSYLEDAQPQSTRKTLAFSEAVLSE